MSMAAIDRTIRVLCAEVEDSEQAAQSWRILTEEELLHEAAICMFSSQMVFEVAEAAANRLRERALLRPCRRVTRGYSYEARIVAALSEPLAVKRAGIVRYVRPRFRNRWASLLCTTVTMMDGGGQSLRDILISASSARGARELLVENVWGFGPKQASLFLRRVGYSADLAVLDTHVLSYLRIARGVSPKPNALSRLKSYELLEAEFQQLAADLGHSVGCVDLAMWITMRVAKREGYL
jgi:N-glycosylase/DNA lyase